MAIPAAQTLVEIEDASGTDLTIKVTGYQWKWQYEYLDSGVSFFSTLSRDSDAARQMDSGVDPKMVPELPARASTTRWSCRSAQGAPAAHLAGRHPRLVGAGPAVKKDAIPGFVNEIWFEIQPDKVGIYRGQCVELCGRDHALHADRRRGQVAGGLRGLAQQPQEAQKQATCPPAATNAG